MVEKRNYVEVEEEEQEKTTMKENESRITTRRITKRRKGEK